MSGLQATLSQIRSGPAGPAVGAFFDFDGTTIEGYSALAFYNHRMRNFEIGPEEATRTMLAAIRGPMNEDQFADIAELGIRGWAGRTEEDLDELGQRLFVQGIAGARFAAPVGEPDPAERIAAVREFVLTARAEPAIGVLDLLAPAVSRMPTALVVGMAAGMTSISDVQASNVAGLGHTAYLAGAKVTHTYMFGPRPGVAAMVGMLSYDGTCRLAFNVDPDAITDIELFSTCMQQGFAEVLELRNSRS